MKKKIFALLLIMIMLMSLTPLMVLAVDSNAVVDKILSSDGSEDDKFGYSVAVSGDWLVVGAYEDDDNGYDSGSVYIYDLSNGTLSDVLASELKLTAGDGAKDDWYGYSVAISGDKVAVGADCNDNGSLSGAVYIYDLSSADVPASELKLTANDGAADDYFGRSVSISGDKVAVGAFRDDDKGDSSGSVYIYDLSNGTGSLSDVLASELKLIASDGAEGDLFGYAVGISGDRVAVGAFCDDDKGSSSGSAYIYDLSNGTGSLSDVLASELKLIASDGATSDRFGCSVSISGDRVAVGAYKDDNNEEDSGSVYIYDLSSGNGTLSDVLASQLKLTASDGAEYDWFGYSVAISGDKVAVGADCNDNGSVSGSVYIYDLSAADVPDSELKLLASDGAAYDYFGRSVAISGDRVAVGAYGNDDNGSESGSVYTYIGKYTVVLDKQGGSGGDDSIVATYNAVLPSASAPSRAGYTFEGYYSETGGGGTKYYNADMTSVHDWDVASETTLYANWTGNSYTVAFNGNGSDGGSMPDQSFTYGTAQSLMANTFSRTYCTFAGWATSDEGEVVYSDGQSVNNLTEIEGNTVTLYAKWTGNFTVTFDKQGGVGGNYSVSAIYDSAMPSAAAPTRQLYTFQGYFTAVNGGGEQYYNADMSSAKDWDIIGDMVLYAYWTESSPLAITTPNLPTGTLGEGYSCTVAVSGGDGSNTWYASGLPDGLNMDRDTGKISGKPNETGDFSVKVTVYDGENRKATKIYTLTVSPPSETGKYRIVPDNDSAYTVGTAGGFTTLTVKDGVTGFRYLKVSINPIVANEGEETCVFVHMRGGVQIGFYATVADYDNPVKATAGFNVKPGDIIKVYIVDELSNSTGSNPVLLQ